MHAFGVLETLLSDREVYRLSGLRRVITGKTEAKDNVLMKHLHSHQQTLSCRHAHASGGLETPLSG